MQAVSPWISPESSSNIILISLPLQDTPGQKVPPTTPIVILRYDCHCQQNIQTMPPQPQLQLYYGEGGSSLRCLISNFWRWEIIVQQGGVMECNQTTRDWDSDRLKYFSPVTSLSFRQFMLKSQSGSQSVEIFCSPPHNPSVERLIITRNDHFISVRLLTAHCTNKCWSQHSLLMVIGQDGIGWCWYFI